jgi:hypothetical protein
MGLRGVETVVAVEERELGLVGFDHRRCSGRQVLDPGDCSQLADGHRGNANRAFSQSPLQAGTLPPVATILLVGVDLFFRGKLDVLLGASHRLTTTESIDPPDLVICDLARVEADEVADTYPDVPILGYTNHTDTAGLRAAQTAGLDKVVVRSALAERAPQLVDELVA